MSSETPIKPGDVVRWGTRERDWVVGPVNRERGVFMPVDKHDGDCWYSLDDCTIVRSVDEAVSKAVVLALASPLTAEPRFREWARKEALARGWRELDREDVTESPTTIDVNVSDCAIGAVYRMLSVAGTPWGWMLWDDVECVELATGGGENKDDAIAKLIAAENARRAKETPHA